MQLTVLYSHAKSKFLAGLYLYRHKVNWVEIGQPIPKTPLLVTAGGDGTINYAVNNIDLSKTKLLVLPLGRGNAFARIHNLPLCVINENHIENFEEVQVPLLEINGRLATFGAGMGKGSEIVHYANPYSQLGASSYLASGLVSLQSNPSLTISVNGEAYHDLLTAEISLWGRIGFGLPLTLQDSPGPYLTLIKGHPFQAAVLFLIGQLPSWDGAKTIQASNFIMETEKDVPSHIDGEPFTSRKLSVGLSGKSVMILRPSFDWN